jgi:pumilio family protein 6
MPEKKEPVLKYMADMLKGCLDKGTLVHSIVHKALLQYLTLADAKGRDELMSLLRDSLQEIVHTREGARVAMLCLSYSSPKDKKAIIKAFKPFLSKIAQDEQGYLVLLRLLDVTDDTVLVAKAVVDVSTFIFIFIFIFLFLFLFLFLFICGYTIQTVFCLLLFYIGTQ